MPITSLSKISKVIGDASEGATIDIIAAELSAQQLLLLIQSALSKKLKLNKMEIHGFQVNSGSDKEDFISFFKLVNSASNAFLLQGLKSFTLSSTADTAYINSCIELLKNSNELQQIDICLKEINTATISSLKLLPSKAQKIFLLKEKTFTPEELDKLKKTILDVGAGGLIIKFQDCCISGDYPIVKFLDEVAKKSPCVIFNIQNTKSEEKGLAARILEIKQSALGNIEELVCFYKQGELSGQTIKQLAQSQILKKLNLSYVQLPATSCKSIVELIKKGAIQSLYFSAQNFGPAQIDEILTALESNRSIIEFNMTGIEPEDENWQRMQRCVFRNQLQSAIFDNSPQKVDKIVQAARNARVDITSPIIPQKGKEDDRLLTIALNNLPENENDLLQRTEIIKRLYLVIIESGRKLDTSAFANIVNLAKASNNKEIQQIFKTHSQLTLSGQNIVNLEREIGKRLMALSSSSDKTKIHLDATDAFDAEYFKEQIKKLNEAQIKLDTAHKQLKDGLGLLVEQSKPDLEKQEMMKKIQGDPILENFQSSFQLSLFRKLNKILLHLKDDPGVMKKLGLIGLGCVVEGGIGAVPLIGNAAASLIKAGGEGVGLVLRRKEIKNNSEIFEQLMVHFPLGNMSEFCLRFSSEITLMLEKRISMLNSQIINEIIESATDMDAFTIYLKQAGNDLDKQEKFKFAIKNAVKKCNTIIDDYLQKQTRENPDIAATRLTHKIQLDKCASETIKMVKGNFIQSCVGHGVAARAAGVIIGGNRIKESKKIGTLNNLRQAGFWKEDGEDIISQTENPTDAPGV